MITNLKQEYVIIASGGTITAPVNGSWLAAYALQLGATGPVNGTWLQAICQQLGITEPVNGSWIQALCFYYGLFELQNNSWWWTLVLGDLIINPAGIYEAEVEAQGGIVENIDCVSDFFTELETITITGGDAIAKYQREVVDQGGVIENIQCVKQYFIELDKINLI